MRALCTFIATMAFGIAAAAIVSAIGFGSTASFILGMAYMVGVALMLNSRRAGA